ncbi:MAG: COG1361 S-layer family protein [Nanobdellota archaeon]
MKNKIKILLLVFSITLCAICVNADERDTPYTKEVMLNQDPDPAKPGEYVKLRWKVTKYGEDTLHDFQYQIKPEYPFYLDPGMQKTKEIGNWKGYSGDDNYYTLYYKLRVHKDAAEDNYDMILRKKSGDEDWSSKTYNIRVEEAKDPSLVIGDVKTSPQELKSDIDESKLEIEITNIGDEGVENLKTQLQLPEGFTPSYSYSDSVVLGTIKAGNSKTSAYYADISEDLESGTYPAKVVARYKEEDDDDNEYKKKVLPINITIKPKPTFEIIDKKINPEVAKPGDTIKVKLKIKNTGRKEGESVSVHAFKDSSQPFDLKEKSDYIGNLKKGEEGEAIITIKAEEDAEKKTHIIDIEIRAIDSDEVITEEKHIELKVDGKENEKKPTPIMGISIIAGIVIIGLGAFYFLKK